MRILDGKIAVITSATRGIGLASAQTLAGYGAKVYLAVRRLDAGREIIEEIKQAGGSGDVVYFDAEKEETFTSMITDVGEKESKIDILVNNFGTTNPNLDLDVVSGDTKTFFDTVNINLKSVYLPVKAAVPYLRQAGGGSIVNISSVGGSYPDISRTAYGVAKSAILFLTKDIAAQYAQWGIRCNAVLPGYIGTDAANQNMSQAFLETFIKTVPLGRAGKPEDIANAVFFFASPLSSYVTGETLEVAGGFGVPSPMFPLYSFLHSVK